MVDVQSVKSLMVADLSNPNSSFLEVLGMLATSVCHDDQLGEADTTCSDPASERSFM